MKSILFLLLLLSFASCNNQDKPASVIENKKTVVTDSIKEEESNEAIFDSLDQKEILNRLFDEPIFDSLGFAVWKPNFNERMNLSLSDDGKCHTKVDTLMYFNDSQNRECAVVIFGTYNFTKNGRDSLKIWDCHFCGTSLSFALLSKTEENKWKLYAFSKSSLSFGYWGVWKSGTRIESEISLKKIGDNWTCLSLKEGIGGNQGFLTGTEYLISLEQFQIGGFPNSPLTNIFTYDYHNGEYTEDEKGEHEKITTRKIRLNKKKGNYSDIELLINESGKKSVEIYEFSDEFGRFVKRKSV